MANNETMTKFEYCEEMHRKVADFYELLEDGDYIEAHELKEEISEMLEDIEKKFLT